MRPEYLYPKRLPPIFAAAAVLSGLWLSPGADSAEKAAAVFAGLTLGCVTGYFEWRRVKRRIFADNRVILYFTDGLAYGFLVPAAILSFFPHALFAAAQMLWRSPIGLFYFTLVTTSFILGVSLVTYIQTRRHERRWGPLRAKTFYSRSVTGPEGLLGKHAIVQRDCSPEGMVKLASELWKARSLGGTILVGESVVVRDIEGLCLLVERLEQSAA